MKKHFFYQDGDKHNFWSILVPKLKLLKNALDLDPTLFFQTVAIYHGRSDMLVLYCAAETVSRLDFYRKSDGYTHN